MIQLSDKENGTPLGKISEEDLQFLIDNYNDPDDLAYACYYYGFSMGIYSVLRMKPEFDANRNLEVPGPKLAKQ